VLNPNAACQTLSSPFVPKSGLNLTWSDEFDVPGSPDPSVWTHEIGIGPNDNGWDHGELQYYTNRLNNSVVSDGSLKIIAKRESFEGSNFTSARLITLDKVDFKYGRVEVRAKLPVGSGTWSAFWMLASDSVYGEWPNSGEIDILEHVGNFPSTVTASTHSLLHNHRANNSDSLHARTCAPVSDWRVYSLEWTPTSIRAFVDNDQYFEHLKARNAEWDSWPFDQDFFLVLNLAVGGEWGSAIKGVDESAFDGPGQVLEIDYVRVYS
jgi:beta-glucanase (GH16 family)